jgi:tRNA A37 threonylcarbamoyladenosine biosynthesis protein TsaE
MSLTHADVYRAETMAEIEDLDLIESSADGVLAVEWGTAIEQWVPADHLVVRIRVEDAETRLIEFLPRGSWATRPLAELEE